MKYFEAAAAIGVLAFASFLLVGTAGANHLAPGTAVTLTCSTASAEYQSFAEADLPITFHITVNGVTHDLVASADAAPDGTATVDISSLTSGFNGNAGTVSADVTWTNHSTHEGAIGPVDLTCGEAPPTTTTPQSPQSSSPATVVSPPAPAATAAPAVAVTNVSPPVHRLSRVGLEPLRRVRLVQSASWGHWPVAPS